MDHSVFDDTVIEAEDFCPPNVSDDADTFASYSGYCTSSIVFTFSPLDLICNDALRSLSSAFFETDTLTTVVSFFSPPDGRTDTHCAFVEIDQSASAVTESDNSEAAASATRFSGETFTVTLPGFTGAGSSPLLPHEANDWVANTIKRIIDINAVLFMSISGLVWLVSLWLRSLPGRERCRSAHSRRSFLFEAAMSHFGCKCSVF